MPEARFPAFLHRARHFLFAVVSLALITSAFAIYVHSVYIHNIPIVCQIGPGTIGLLYLIVIILASLHTGLAGSLLVALAAAFCLDYFVFPLFLSFAYKNPFDIVANVVFLISAWVISGFVTQVRRFTDAQFDLRLQNTIRMVEVQETERRNLALELHDEVGQLLTGLGLLLRAAENSSGEGLKTRLEQAREMVDDLLARIRTLSFDLRPADLDQLGLLPALLALFERFTSQTGVLVNFAHQGMEGPFAADLQTGVYRVMQEALTNVARHASVEGVKVRVWLEAGQLKLQIDDRGCGFDPDIAFKAPRSSGLIGMRERIMALRGSVAFDSSKGAGTTISAELPLNKDSKDMTAPLTKPWSLL